MKKIHMLFFELPFLNRHIHIRWAGGNAIGGFTNPKSFF